MAPTTQTIDNAEQIRRFIEAMNAGDPPANTSALEESEEVASEPDENMLPTALTTGDTKTSPLSNSTAPTPYAVRSRGGSESMQPTPSPNVRGLRAPENTPQTVPHSPRFKPQDEDDVHDGDVIQQVFNIASTIKGKGLQESMWAHKPHHPSPLGFQTQKSQDLTPTKAVEHNDDIHETYERMSFKVADAHLGDSTSGDRSVTNPFITPALKNDLTKKLEALKNKQASVIDMSEVNEGLSKHISQKENTPFGSPDRETKKLTRSRPSYFDGGSSDRISSEQLSAEAALRGGDDESQMTTQMRDSSVEEEDKQTAFGGASTGDWSVISRDTPIEPLTLVENLPPHLKHQQQFLQKSSAILPRAGTNILKGGEKPSNASKETLNANSDSAKVETPKIKEGLSASTSSEFMSKWLQKVKLSPDKLESTEGESSSGETAFSKHNESSNVMDASTKAAASEAFNEQTTEAAIGNLPQLVVGSTRTSLASTKDKDEENLESKLFFGAWPKSTVRDRPAAQIRTVTIRSLPNDATPSFVSSLVFGGAVEKIHVQTSANFSPLASVRFLDPAACAAFFEATSNGLVYGRDAQGRELVAWVEQIKDVDVIGGLLTNWILAGTTRCVRAVPVEKEMSKEYLWKMAERKGRVLEGMKDDVTKSGLSRYVIWRFCDIAHAVQFKAALARDEEWEAINVTFASDPCARETPETV